MFSKVFKVGEKVEKILLCLQFFVEMSFAFNCFLDFLEGLPANEPGEC